MSSVTSLKDSMTSSMTFLLFHSPLVFHNVSINTLLTCSSCSTVMPDVLSLISRIILSRACSSARIRFGVGGVGCGFNRSASWPLVLVCEFPGASNVGTGGCDSRRTSSLPCGDRGRLCSCDCTCPVVDACEKGAFSA